MIAYITGTSSGIGKALAEILLDNNHQVVGLSRRQTIEHVNYRHITIDLSDMEEVKNFDFPVDKENDIILVNNAGTVGPIKPVGQHTNDDIISLNNLNVITPQMLSNKFINRCQNNKKLNYQIINISSGAGKRPIDAWATYCASKAAIDLFSETIAEELKVRNHNNWKIYSIAPGVVDTEMQSAIRASNPEDFFNHEKFINLKINNELSSSESVSQKILRVLTSKKMSFPVVFSLKDIS